MEFRISMALTVLSLSSLRKAGVRNRPWKKLYFVLMWVPTRTFSMTRILGKRRRFWKVREMPRVTISWGVLPSMRSSRKEIAPSVI